MAAETDALPAPNWLSELEKKRETRLKARLGHEAGAGAPCIKCNEKCPGLDLHFWRKICKNCKCSKEDHDVHDDDIYGWAQFQLLGSKPNRIKKKIILPGKKEEQELEWAPKGNTETIDRFLQTVAPDTLPVKGSEAAKTRKQLLQKQIPIHDLDPTLCHELTDSELAQMQDYIKHMKGSAGVGQIVQFGGAHYGNLHVTDRGINALLLSSRYPKGVPPSLESVQLQGELKAGQLTRKLGQMNLGGGVDPTQNKGQSLDPRVEYLNAANSRTLNSLPPNSYVSEQQVQHLDPKYSSPIRNPNWNSSEVSNKLYRGLETTQGIPYDQETVSRGSHTIYAENQNVYQPESFATSLRQNPGPNNPNNYGGEQRFPEDFPQELNQNFRGNHPVMAPSAGQNPGSYPSFKGGYDAQNTLAEPGRFRQEVNQNFNREIVNRGPNTIYAENQNVYRPESFATGLAPKPGANQIGNYGGEQRFPGGFPEEFNQNFKGNDPAMAPSFGRNPPGSYPSFKGGYDVQNTPAEPGRFPQEVNQNFNPLYTPNQFLISGNEQEQVVGDEFAGRITKPLRGSGLSVNNDGKPAGFNSLGPKQYSFEHSRMTGGPGFANECSNETARQNINKNLSLPSYSAGRYHVTANEQIPGDIGSLRDLAYSTHPMDGTNVPKALQALNPNELPLQEHERRADNVKIGVIRDLVYETPEIKTAYHKENDIFNEAPIQASEKLPTETQQCKKCAKYFQPNEFAIFVEKSNALYHTECFKCAGCNQNLADLLYFYDKEMDDIYCGRDFAKIRGIPRCKACDELIFVKEYCLAENYTFHLKHFCCFECDEALAGKNYVVEDSQPICVPCFERVKASRCCKCLRVISPDEEGVSLTEKVHFHTSSECFCCSVCRKALKGAKLMFKNNKLYCSSDCFKMNQ